MKTYVKPTSIDRDGEQTRIELIAVFEACIACELSATIAADTLARSQTSRAGLLACAAVMGEAAFRLSQLEVPDSARVHDELVACRAACVAAREAVGASNDALALVCVRDCARCEAACNAIAWSFYMAA